MKRKLVAILTSLLIAVGLVAVDTISPAEAGAYVTNEWRVETRTIWRCHDIQVHRHDNGMITLNVYTYNNTCTTYYHHSVSTQSWGHFCWYLEDDIYGERYLTLQTNIYTNNNIGSCLWDLPGDWQSYDSPYTDFGSGSFYHHNGSGWVDLDGWAAWHPEVQWVVRDGSHSHSPVVDWERGFRLY